MIPLDEQYIEYLTHLNVQVFFFIIYLSKILRSKNDRITHVPQTTKLIKVNYPRLVDIYDVDDPPTDAGAFELITLRCDSSLSYGYKSEQNSREELLGFHSSSSFVDSRGWYPVALPVSGSASNFYTAGAKGAMIPWNLKSQSSENGDYVRKGRASLQGKKQLWWKERGGMGKAGDTSSHPFRRIENHDVSFVSETRASRFFRKLAVRRGKSK